MAKYQRDMALRLGTVLNHVGMAQLILTFANLKSG